MSLTYNTCGSIRLTCLVLRRQRLTLNREPGTLYPSGGKSGAAPATVCGRACSKKPLGITWEGEHTKPNNHEPEDLPGIMKPITGAGVP